MPLIALLFAVACSLALASCSRKDGDAIVLEKEHIPVAEPAASPSSASESADMPTPREMLPDEIAVGGVVMKASDRGTSRDPRALKNEQWLVTVRLVDGGRIFKVPVQASQFDRLKPGDRVHVRYQVGNYTGTVWGAQSDIR